jgi:aldehyde:ferredoxin oxidoreductase
MPSSFAAYSGRLLDVDLTSGAWSIVAIDDAVLEKFVGGKTLAARLLWDNLVPGVDPLSPENVIVLTPGPFTGSGVPAGSRFNLSTKNVLTGGIVSSNCGGDFGIYLKRAGFDAVILRGRAARPTWLAVDEAGGRLRDARHLWGLNVDDVQATLPAKMGHLVIGPGGENLVRYACILSGERALGRGGVGAVMGSKNLKLVTAEGSRRIVPRSPDAFRKVVKKWVATLQDHSITGKQLPRYGTAGLVSATNATNTLCTHNFQKGHWEHAHEVSGEEMADRHLVVNDGCSSCPIRCGRVVEKGGKEIKGPEFETVGMFGPNIENSSLRSIINWNHQCDRVGLDTISLGSTLATAMELKERGLLPDLPVSFGHFDGLETLIDDIAWRRNDIGDALAEGAMRLARTCGEPGLAMHSKGMEFAAYEPRGAVGHGLGYAVSNRGGCHLNGGYLVFFEALGPLNMDPLTPTSKPMWVVFQQNLFEALSACGGCIFPSYAVIPDLPGFLASPTSLSARVGNKILQGARFALGGQGKMKAGLLPFHLPLVPHSKALETLTGIPMSLGLFTAIGERGYTLERLFNLREGLTAADDALPPRMTDEPQQPDRPDTKVPLAEMLPVYYKVRDWDSRGVPTRELLEKLDLGFADEVVATLETDPMAFRARRLGLFAEEDGTLRAVLAEARRQFDEVDACRAELAEASHRAERVARAAWVRTRQFIVDASRCRKCGLCAKACPVQVIAWQQGTTAVIDQAGCIRCGKCHAVCPSHYRAILTPEAPAVEHRAHLEYRVIDDRCKMCGICPRECPVQCIAWQKKTIARIDPEACVACGRCLAVCPDKFAAIERLDRSLTVG